MSQAYLPCSWLEAPSGVCSVCPGSSFIQVAWLCVDGKAFKCRRVVGGYQAWDIVCPLNEEEEETQRKTWRRAEASVLQSASSCGPPVSYPTTLPRQGVGLDLHINGLVSRKSSKQKTIYLRSQVSLELGLHFRRHIRLPSDSWRWRWRCGYALVLCCFTRVLCLCM